MGPETRAAPVHRGPDEALPERCRNPLVSVVVPLLDEQEVLPELIRRLQRMADGNPNRRWEFLLVDDGSTDGTPGLLAEVAARDGRFKPITLSRNFGHQEAITAGLDLASGDAIAVIDGDLQDPPEMIQEMLERWEAGVEVVYAVKQTREEPLLMRLLYAGYYRLLRWAASTEIPLDSGDCALMDRKVVEVLKQIPDRSRFLRGLRAWVGFRQEPYLYHRHARGAGRSKYGWRKLTLLAIDGLVSFSELPLRIGMWVGLAMVSVGAVYAIGAALITVLSWESRPAGFATLLIALTFLSGLQLLMMSLIGEYIIRIFKESKGRPLYIIKDALNLSPEGSSTTFGIRAPLQKPAKDGAEQD